MTPIEVTIKEYIDQRFVDLEARVDARFDAMVRAVEVTETTVRERFATVNEFRGALNDLSTRLVNRSEHDKLASDLSTLQLTAMRRDEYATNHTSLTRDVKDLQLAKSNLDGRMIIIAGLVAFASSILVSIIGLILNDVLSKVKP